jgi:HAD superfamily hydrolase (TIGR01509 family)
MGARKLGGVLFDVDNVLVYSEIAYYEIISRTFEPYGIRIGHDEYVQRWMIDRTNSAGVVRDYGLSERRDEIKRLKDRITEEVLKRVGMMPYAMEMLNGLHGKYPLGMVTSDTRRNLGMKIGRHGIAGMFKAVVTWDDVKNQKPHPEPYLRGAELLGVEPREVVVIEDNPTGVDSALAAGCVAVGYPNGFTAEMDFSKSDRVIDSLAEVDEGFLVRLMGNVLR